MSATNTASRAASDAASHVTSNPLGTLGRIGYTVKGVVYALLGGLAFQAALGGGSPEGQEGTFEAIADTDWGAVVLWTVAVGLAAYGAWRVALAVLDAEDEGTDAEGLGKRAFYALSGLSYAGLAFTAYKVVQGTSGDNDGTRDKAATLMGMPGGRWIVAAFALVLFGYGLHQARRAYEASFMKKIEHEGLAASHRDLVRRAGQWGLGARAVVYVIIGGFMGLAAWRANPDEARGLDGALATLQEQPFGPYLLGAVGLGLVMYGVYCWVNAAYRRYGEAD